MKSDLIAVALAGFLLPGCLLRQDDPDDITLRVANLTGETARLFLQRDEEPIAIELQPGATETFAYKPCPSRVEFISLSLGDRDAARVASFDAAPFRVLEKGVHFDCGAFVEVRVDAANTEVLIDGDEP